MFSLGEGGEWSYSLPVPSFFLGKNAQYSLKMIKFTLDKKKTCCFILFGIVSFETEHLLTNVTAGTRRGG